MPGEKRPKPEASFPRGRAAVAAVKPSAAGAKSIAEENAGSLFRTRKEPDAGAAKKKPRPSKTEAVADEADDGDAEATRAMQLPKRVHKITFKRLSVGMSLLAQVVACQPCGGCQGMESTPPHVSKGDGLSQGPVCAGERGPEVRGAAQLAGQHDWPVGGPKSPLTSLIIAHCVLFLPPLRSTSAPAG